MSTTGHGEDPPLRLVEDPDERLSNLEERMGSLEGRMDALVQSIDLLRKEIEGAFYGSDHDPQKTEQMKRVGLLRKLDRLDDMATTLQEIRDALTGGNR